MSSEAGQLGLVAIVRNEGNRLKLCLKSVPRGIPIMYVDSGSTDGSVTFARSLGAKVIQLDMRQPFTAARARNEGLRELLIELPELQFVQFVDGDCELESGWLAEGEAFLAANEAYGAVCGRRRERFPEASFYNRMCDDEWDTPIGDALACGGDALYRITAIVDAGGFDPLVIAGEEPELCARLRSKGWKIRRLDIAMTIHDANMMHTLQWWRRSVRCGYGYAQVWRKTATSGGPSIYGRQIASALFWTLGIAMLALVLAIGVSPWALLVAPAAWILQLVRLSFRVGWMKGAHLLAGKVAESWGALRYAMTAMRGSSQGAIFYK
ncbi:MAG: glycosyltransferase [Erythrobacteraceae bacterium]